MLKSTNIPKEVDVVVAGGGTTGLVVASRLAKADPGCSILVLESGPDVRNNPGVINPALFATNIAPGSKTSTVYTSAPSEYLGGRRSFVHTGNCLGGGSSINFQVYTRPQKIDFDDWETEGWRGDDMIPFFRKFENFQDTDTGIDKTLHGYTGELIVSSGTNVQVDLQNDFFKACKDIGLDFSPDVQDFKTSNAVGKWNMWVDKRNGFRQNVPRGFLYPILDAGNTGLQVATEIQVVRVLFDEHDKSAVAVEYVANGSEDSVSDVKVVRARKLVILAAGALGTPQILERSGVGDANLLSKLNIPLVADLPGVGSNYQDHNFLPVTYKSTASKDTSIGALLSGKIGLEEALELKKSSPDRYILGSNGIDCIGKTRPTEQEVESFAPCLKEAWERDFKNRPEKPIMLFGVLSAYLGDYTAIEPGTYMTSAPYTAYPYSRGTIHIRSVSPAEPPEFDPGFLSHPVDVEQLVYGYKMQREIFRRMSHYGGVLESTHPIFPPESKADYNYVDTVSREKGFPIPIEYSAEDDESIRKFAREKVATTWHSMGTCAMKKREAGGVVDEKLNVYGVLGLKVVDLSICPGNVAANTYATALAIAEKAASIIVQDLACVD